MQNLSLILTQVKELLILNNSSVKNFKNTDGVNLARKVSNDNTSDAEDDLLEFDEEDINEPVNEIDVEEAKKDIISSIVSLLHTGGIDEEISSKIMEMLGGEFDEKSVEQLEELINNSAASTPEKVVVKDKDGINEVLNSLDASAKSKILEQVDGIDSISSVSCFEDGSYQIETNNNGAFIAYPSGKIVSSYDNDAKTGIDNYNEEGKISNSTYINHAMNDSVVQENYTYNEDGGYTKTIDDSSNPSQQKIVEMSPDNEVMSVSTKNTQTGEIEQNYVSEKYYPSQSGGIGGSNDFDSSGDSNIGDLEQERDEVSKDLEENQNSYTETENEKEGELDTIDTEIGSGEGELSNANNELDGANTQVDDAASNADEAQSEVDASQNDVDNTQSELESAESQAQQAQGQEQVAAQDNQTKIQEQNNANQDYGTATGELNEAQGAANEAQGVADDTNSDLVEATGETSTAFNVLNQKQAEVDAAQQEYNSANAAENKEDESLWTKFKNWVSSLWDKLTDAITGRDEAAREAENKKNEEEKARAVDEEAQEALSERKEEQKTAQDVADSAQVVLDRKTGEREVSDQEYADALLDLADAMSVKDDATGEYDSALEQYKEKYNYKVDADGNLVDAQGKQVSCAQVVEELEAFVQDLNYTRVNTETSYDTTLNATSAAISGDQTKIQELDTRITQLKQENARKEQELAMQEQMLSELAKQKGELNSSKDSAGIGDDIAAIFGGSYKGDEEQFKTKQEALEKALKSGDEKDIQAAYKAIYGDKEVVIDASGNIIDPSTLDEEELAKCTTSKISDLSAANLTNQMEMESTAAINASLLVDQINAGTFVANGKTVTMEQLNAALEKQADDLIKQMEDAASQQGIISKGIGAVNNLFGIGTSETEAKAQVGQYKAMVERLKTCKDPKEFAALYKSVTGNNFNATNMISLLAYDTIKNPDETKGSEQKGEPAPELVDLTDCIDEIRTNVDEQADGNADVLLQTGNSKAAESIQDYIETQKTAKDAIIGVAEGIIAVAAVAAAPFTGGASLLLAAGVGAATGITLNAVDSIYDKNGDGTLEFNYTLKEAVQDGLSGSLNGAIGVFSAGAGGAVTKSIGSSAAKNMVTTTFNQSFKKAALNFGSKMAGAAVEGIIDGGVSSGGQYIIEAATNKDVEFSFSKLAEVTGQGAAFGAIFNVGLKGTGEILSGTSKYIKARGLEKEINAILAQGGGDSSIAKMIAGKLDDGLMSGGKVNRYAVSQLMSNAEDSLKALKGMGFSENTAMSILDDVPLKTQADLPKVIEGISKNANLLSGGKKFSNEQLSEIIEGLDDIQLDRAGNLMSMSVTDAKGVKSVFEFDAKGKLTSVNSLDKTVDAGDTLDKVDQLIKAGKLANIDIKNKVGLNGEISETLKNDIDLLYSAYKKGIDPKDAFVKNFSNADEALSRLGTGDICNISGSNKISIKLADGTLQELNISPEKYMELFPPVERFAISQQKIGDCYLVASLNSMLTTPDTRVNILQCFSENADGSVRVTLPDGKVNFNLKAGQSLEDFVESSKIIQGPEGIKMLEYTYGLELLNDALEQAQKNLDEVLADDITSLVKQNEAWSDFYTKILNSKGNIDIAAIKKEMDNLPYGDMLLSDYIPQVKRGFLDKIFTSTDNGLQLNTKYLRESIEQNRLKTQDIINSHNEQIVTIKTAIKNLTENPSMAENLRDQGGFMQDVFARFGLKDNGYMSVGSKNIDDLILNQDNWSNYLFGGGTNGTSDTIFLNEELNIAGRHAYSIKPYVDANGEVLFKVTNPWNTIENKILTYEQIKEYFHDVYYANLVGV